MKILYFAWVRERVGTAEEEIELPADVTTPAELIGWLKSRGPEFESAFERPEIIRVALDQVHVEQDAPLGSPREVALFPPMTGG